MNIRSQLESFAEWRVKGCWKLRIRLEVAEVQLNRVVASERKREVI